jgi:hypothetical protein
MPHRHYWTLNKLIVLALIGAFVGLLLEIRYMHRHVLGEEPVSWTPLIYSGVMILGGSLALALWDRGGRQVLWVAFALALIVGPTGFWYHNMGHPVAGLRRLLSAWSEPIGGEEGHTASGYRADAPELIAAGARERQEDHTPPEPHGAAEPGEAETEHEGHGEGHIALPRPPVLAPLAFFGLGLIGMLACSRRFQPPTT